MAEHLLGDLEVGDHAVPERADRPDRGRGPADHPPRLGADGVHLARLLREGDNRRLEQDNPLAADEHQGVRRAEVDRQIAAAAEGPPK